MNLPTAIGNLPPKDKTPNSARVLNTWIAHAERQLGSDGGRLGWIVASTVVTAALQQAVDDQGKPLFLLKGGTLLQFWLPQFSRATTDVDGLIRGDLDKFLAILDEELTRPWGPLTLQRGLVEMIKVPHRVIKPRSFHITAQLKGVTWRRVQVEITPDEGQAGHLSEPLSAPSLVGFGLPSPEQLVGLSLRYQIAQKTHAVTDPYDPPVSLNDRARDVVDLILLRDRAENSGHPSVEEIRSAAEDIFQARSADAATTGGVPRAWPARLTAHPHWAADYHNAAKSASFTLPMTDAIDQVNVWIREISGS